MVVLVALVVFVVLVAFVVLVVFVVFVFVPDGAVPEPSVTDVPVVDVSVVDRSVPDRSVDDASVEDVAVPDASVEDVPEEPVPPCGCASVVHAVTDTSIIAARSSETIFFVIVDPPFGCYGKYIKKVRKNQDFVGSYTTFVSVHKPIRLILVIILKNGTSHPISFYSSCFIFFPVGKCHSFKSLAVASKRASPHARHPSLLG